MVSRPSRNLDTGDLVDAIAVTRRFDLTCAQWARLEPLLPKGRSRVGCRRGPGASSPIGSGGGGRGTSGCAVAGCSRRLRLLASGVRAVSPLAAGRDLAADGDGLQARADTVGLITWDVRVDPTIARAHQHTRRRPGGAVRDRRNRRAVREWNRPTPVGPFPWWADYETASGVREGSEAVIAAADRRPAGRQPATRGRGRARAQHPGRSLLAHQWPNRSSLHALAAPL
jgi:hypothetical protein